MLRLLAALASAGPLPIGAAAAGRGSLQCADADRRCERYSKKPFLCSKQREDGFSQLSECCMCKHWEQRPLPAANCSNTDRGRVGFAGYACGLYISKPHYCGMADTKEFKALDMCCDCQTFAGGGGHDGPVCPRSARNTVPDGEGLCHCSEGWGCVEGGGGAGSGCPAAGERRLASFDVGCAHCTCSRQEVLLERDQGPCYGALEEDLTPEGWIVSLAMTSVLERLQSLLWATRDVHAMWFEHSDLLDLAEESEVASNERLLRSWARILFKASVRSNFAAQNCGVVFGGGRGGFVGVSGGGCESPNEPVLLRSLNGETLKSFKLRSAGCKMETALSGTWSCDPTAMWIEGWTANETLHVKVDGDQEREVVGPYWASEESWLDAMWLRTDDFLLLGHYNSHISRVGVQAFGVWLRTLDEPALVRCEMTSQHLSEVVGTLVPVNARMFIMTGSGTLLASSHGEVEEQAGLLKRHLNYSENQDPVVRYVGMVVHNQLRSGTVSPTMTVPWPGKFTRLQTFVQRNPGLDVTVILVNPPQCEPGMELPPGQDWTDDDDEGKQITASACQRCSVGKKSEEGAKMGERCVNCSHGSYGRLDSSTTCFTCEVGKYQDEVGATDCKPCAEHRTSHPGAKSMRDCHCKERYYSLSTDMALACRECPDGAYCAGNESLPIALPMHFSLGPEAVVRCVPTLTGTSCLGGQGGEDLVRVPAQPPYDKEIVNYCDTGYDGIACSYCTEGYYRFGRDCIKCVEGTDKSIVMAFLLLMVLFYMLRRVVNSRYKTLYIFMTFLQVFSIQGSFPMKWPVSARHVMRVMQMANLQVDLLLPFCSAQRNFPFFYQFAGTLVLPWFFLLVDLTVISFQRACAQRKAARISGTGGFSAREAALSQIAGLRERSTRDLVIDFLAQAVLNFRLMYLSLCGRTFDMLRCTNFSERHSRLSADLHFMCWEGVHASYMPLVMFAMIVHVIGTPLAYAVIMVKGYKGNVLYSHEHIRRYGVLYSRFEPRFFYWELVIIARRFLCVVIKTSMNIRKAKVQELGYVGNYQAALVAFVMLLSLVLHFYARPFANPWQDFGDAVYMFGTFASCIIGLCLSAAKTDEERLAFEVLFHVNLYLVFLATLLLIWRDVEAEHPTVLRQRQALFERLGLDSMRKAPSRWLRRRLTGQHSVAFVDAVEDLALAALPAEDSWVPGMEALHGLALYERLKAAGLEVPRKQISVSVSVLDKDSFEVLSIVAPPFGITTVECEEALQGSRQLEVLREFAEPLLTVCRALPVPAGPRRAEVRELVPGVRWSQLAEVPPLLAGLRSMLETAVYEESAGRGLPLPRGCLELTLSQGEAPDSLLVATAVAVPEELEVDAVQAMLDAVSHEELVQSLARGLAEACGGVLPPHQSIPCVMMPRTPKVEAC